jgi:hypothetical protein
MYPWNQPPTSGVIYIPTPAPATSASGGFDIDAITRQIAGLEALKKLMKEEKKDDKKDDKDKKKELSVPSVMLLMILLSPITGPIMSRFFQWGLASLPH